MPIDMYRLIERCAAHVPGLAGRTITPHVIRHTTACHLVLAGVDINTIRAWLGQKSAGGDGYIGSMIGRGFANGWDAGQIFHTIDRLQEEQPSDDLVSTFLIAASQGTKQTLDHATAVELANRIADPGNI